MKNKKIVFLNLFIVSAVVICFEIVSTRISSLIFENNYAFIIISLAILSIGCGAIYAYYRIKSVEDFQTNNVLLKTLILIISALLIFVISCTTLKIVTNPFIYFFLLSLPFFFAGVFYSVIFKIYAENSFKLYAADLIGAAIGSILPVISLNYLGAVNSILLLVILSLLALIVLLKDISLRKSIYVSCFIPVVIVFMIYNGVKNSAGDIPIGKFPEKDFYFVYPDAETKSTIKESRWSIFGRSDLVEYNHQDVIKQLFIDGAAGSPMYRFNGDVKKPGKLLFELLANQTGTIPYFFLQKNLRNNMLVIGPGGGREVLIGLIEGFKKITAVEINPDFVNLVKENKDFNGGIYSNFPNVEIVIEEGRHFIKRSETKYDVITMALPSTKQLQNIEAFAMNENYLLTVEAIKDYLKILTTDGRLIFTLHNQWELVRLIITAMKAFEENGIDNKAFLNHIAIVDAMESPTIVIKKSRFSSTEIDDWQQMIKKIPTQYPPVTYLSSVSLSNQFITNRFLDGIKNNSYTVNSFINSNKYNLAPCEDDSPYFYKVFRGVSAEYVYLVLGIFVFCFLIIAIPYRYFNKKEESLNEKKKNNNGIFLPLEVFIATGLGFMVIEISLFQKMVLYLGSPTVSLSVLLSSLLLGMGSGSYFGKRIYSENHFKRLNFISISIVAAGILLYLIYPIVLGFLLQYSIYYRAIAAFIMLLPFGFLLGIPFPTSIQLLKVEDKENLIPWMYGVNGAMSVLGSVLAVIVSMVYGFSLSYFIGLFFYLIIFLVTKKYQTSDSELSVVSR